MNQWCTQDSDGCGQFIQEKSNILHLWHLSEKLLMNYEEKSKLNSKKKNLVHTNSIHLVTHKKSINQNENKGNIEVTKLYTKFSKTKAWRLSFLSKKSTLTHF